MVSNNRLLVVVTGVTGFIGAHVVKRALEAGYGVRGTVRNLPNYQILDEESGILENTSNYDEVTITKKKEELRKAKEASGRIDWLYKLCPEASHSLQLVEADLTDPTCWPSIVKDATFIVHIASPFPKNLNDDVVEIAITGTKGVLTAAVESKTVKRVVLTSSLMAVSLDNATGEQTEDMWADVNSCRGYAKSKVLAEKAAWDYIDSLPDDEKIELVVLNPGLVIGPMLNKNVGTSLDLIKQMITGKMPALLRIQLHIVDVRDVAEAHVNALTSDAAKGHRHICVSQSLWLADFCRVLKEEFTSQGYHISTTYMPYALMWMLSFFVSQVSSLKVRYNKECFYTSTRLKDALGVTVTDPKKSIIDSAYSLIENGHVPKTAKYKGPSEPEQLGTA